MGPSFLGTHVSLRMSGGRFMTPRRAPWYSFLYTLLGAHGTFWLWIAAVATLWWTWHGAVLSFVNRSPEARAAGLAARSRDLRRWVTVSGVRLRLDKEVLLRDEDADFRGTEVLIDDEDPSARFWRSTRMLADADAGAHEEPLLRAAAGTSSLAGPSVLYAKVRARQVLETRMLDLQTRGKDLLPRPEAALLVLPATGAPVSSESLGTSGAASTDTEDYYRRVTAWREAVRTHVTTGAECGLLDDAPARVRERLETDPGIKLGANALRVGRTPNDVELYVFCFAALVFLFLATGLHGAVTASRTEVGKGPSTP
jgi:hypothetical protein